MPDSAGATARDCTVVSVTATGASGPERSATYTNSSSKGTMTAINASVRRCRLGSFMAAS